MKGKFGVMVLLLSSTAFADPVSTPEQPTVDKGVDPMVIQFGGPVSTPSTLSDTPIILVSLSCTNVGGVEGGVVVGEGGFGSVGSGSGSGGGFGSVGSGSGSGGGFGGIGGGIVVGGGGGVAVEV